MTIKTKTTFTKSFAAIEGITRIMTDYGSVVISGVEYHDLASAINAAQKAAQRWDDARKGHKALQPRCITGAAPHGQQTKLQETEK